MKKYLLPFSVFVCLFFMWGFAHSILDILNKHFQDIFVMSKAKSAWVQVAVYGGYFIAAIPAGMFIKKFSYKLSVVFGLMLFALGAFLFIPAEHQMSFPFFIGALFIIGTGLTFLETASNPYIVALGDPEKGASRLNFAQSFNGLGWIFGPMVGGLLIFNKDGSAGNVAFPYMIIGIVVFIMGILFLFLKLPHIAQPKEASVATEPHRSIFRNGTFVFGVIALFFYVGAQTSVNSFFINYVLEVNNRLTPRDASLLLSLGGMGLFMVGRFVGSFILKKVDPARLLKIVSLLSIVSMVMIVLSLGYVSLFFLFLNYLFMAIMFPTIFALSIQSLAHDKEKGSSILIMSIVGGAVFPPLMGMLGEKSIAIGYLIPMVCFGVVYLFARGMKSE